MSQSNSMRMAARCCLTVGFGGRRLQRLDIGGDVQRFDVSELADLVLPDPAKEVAHGPVIGHAGVLIANLCCKEFQEPSDRVVAGACDHRRHSDHAPHCRRLNQRRALDHCRHVAPLGAHDDTLDDTLKVILDSHMPTSPRTRIV